VRGGTNDEKAGRSIVRRSMEEPLRQIAINAGFEGGVVVEQVRAGEGAFGFNAQTGVYEDLFKAGVPDPAKVTRSTIQNAASIAALLLTTEALVAEQKEEAPAMPGGGHDHGGGMDF
jgi:chaperonin GroEL